jgi:hypothetical protein
VSSVGEDDLALDPLIDSGETLQDQRRVLPGYNAAGDWIGVTAQIRVQPLYARVEYEPEEGGESQETDEKSEPPVVSVVRARGR